LGVSRSFNRPVSRKMNVELASLLHRQIEAHEEILDIYRSEAQQRKYVIQQQERRILAYSLLLGLFLYYR
jgi:hypothetical protein